MDRPILDANDSNSSRIDYPASASGLGDVGAGRIYRRVDGRSDCRSDAAHPPAVSPGCCIGTRVVRHNRFRDVGKLGDLLAEAVGLA